LRQIVSAKHFRTGKAGAQSRWNFDDNGTPDRQSTTVLCDELDAGLFESASHILKSTRIWLPYSTLEVRNSLRGRFACL
jgi:hypothetical protein